MEFLKELIELQHQQIVKQVSEKLLNDDLDDFEKEQFIKKFTKKNYCLVKVCNCKMTDYEKDCVKVEDLLSTLTL
tara:strand:- start:235 stop:459 length:225 start_codon:yes stop_codon:yes gene_type:complete